MSKLSPIDGLIRYINNDVKPFHSKVVEILVEYVASDKLDCTIRDQLHISTQIGANPLSSYYKYGIASVTSDGYVIALINPNQLHAHGYLDIASTLHVGSTISISESRSGDDLQSNDGRYTISSVDVDHQLQQVLVTLEVPVPFLTLPSISQEGYVRLSSLGFACVEPITYTNPVMDAPCAQIQPPRVCEGGFGYAFDPVSGDTIDDAQPDPNEPYAIVDTNSASNYFVLTGDQTAFFPYSREFTVSTGTNSGRYYVLHSGLQSDGRTRVYVVQDILNDHPTNVAVDGFIETPGSLGGRYLYSFGFDSGPLCSEVPNMQIDTVIQETLAIKVLDGTQPLPVGWDKRDWDRVRWDTPLYDPPPV